MVLVGVGGRRGSKEMPQTTACDCMATCLHRWRRRPAAGAEDADLGEDGASLLVLQPVPLTVKHGKRCGL